MFVKRKKELKEVFFMAQVRTRKRGKKWSYAFADTKKEPHRSSKNGEVLFRE